MAFVAAKVYQFAWPIQFPNHNPLSRKTRIDILLNTNESRKRDVFFLSPSMADQQSWVATSKLLLFLFGSDNAMGEQLTGALILSFVSFIQCLKLDCRPQAIFIKPSLLHVYSYTARFLIFVFVSRVYTCVRMGVTDETSCRGIWKPCK